MKWLSHIYSILKRASNNGFFDVNPAQRVRVGTGSAVYKARSRLPFDKAELKRIFSTNLFAERGLFEPRHRAMLVAL